MGVTRISVSLDRELVARMDSFMRARGVGNRSGLVAAALESFMAEHAALEKSGARLHGAIVVFYRTGERGSEEGITEAQHKYLDVIMGTFHIHVSEGECMELIIVKGGAGRIRKIIEELLPLRGVISVKPILHETT